MKEPEFLYKNVSSYCVDNREFCRIKRISDSVLLNKLANLDEEHLQLKRIGNTFLKLNTTLKTVDIKIDERDKSGVISIANLSNYIYSRI
jgi:hypothetical protein